MMHFHLLTEDAHVRGYIRHALESSGRTQKELAAHLGFSEKHVSFMLTGKSGITLTTLLQVSAYCGTPIVGITEDKS